MIPFDPASGTYKPCAAGSVSVPAPATRPRPNTHAATLSSFSSSGYAGEGGAPTGDSSRRTERFLHVARDRADQLAPAAPPDEIAAHGVQGRRAALTLPGRFRLGANSRGEAADEQRDRQHH